MTLRGSGALMAPPIIHINRWKTIVCFGDLARSAPAALFI
jgi:hypothetical protein